MELQQLLQLVIDRKASDLHLAVGVAPTLRIDGTLVRVPNEPPLSPQEAERLVKSSLNAEQQEKAFANKELDFSYSFSANARFRVNVYFQKGTVAAAYRSIPLKIPTIEELQLPAILHKFTQLRQGFILVTGPTGHGKSTTLAAMLNEINNTRSVHILTIEDPVEFVLTPAQAIISQREMGYDTHSWPGALRAALREDPNVVLIGEMRDLETIQSALTIAETGHLVFATLHTNSASQTVDRVVDVFPEEQQKQIRLQLANVFEAVFSQRLLPKVGGGRIAAYEIMTSSNAIKTAIREGKTHQIDNIIQTSAEIGMTTFETSLANLVKQGIVSREVAVSFALRPEHLGRLLEERVARGVAKTS